MDLYWRPVGILVRFVLVIHPTRGRKILLCTDRSLEALEIIRLYGIRFKIEVAFKQAVHMIGTYSDPVWMGAMKRRAPAILIMGKSIRLRRRAGGIGTVDFIRRWIPLLGDQALPVFYPISPKKQPADWHDVLTKTQFSCPIHFAAYTPISKPRIMKSINAPHDSK